MNEFWVILGMMAVTFGVRYPVLAIVGRLRLPPAVLRGLRYVPAAVLTALIVPLTLQPEGTLDLAPTNSHMIGAIVACLVAWRTKNLLLTILIGMGVFLLWRALVG